MHTDQQFDTVVQPLFGSEQMSAEMIRRSEEQLAASIALLQSRPPKVSRQEPCPLFPRSGAMVEQVTKLLPVCVACSRRMTFVDAIGSPEGPIAIFRCPDCKKLLWETPRRDEK